MNIPVVYKKLLKRAQVLVVLFLLLIIGLIFGWKYWLSLQKPIVNEDTGPEIYTVAISRRDLSEQDVLKTFGRKSVAGVTDSGYKLRLDATQFEILKNKNIAFNVLPSQFLRTRNGYGIWRVQFYPPVYSTKIQAAANYSRIIQEDSDQSILVWTDESHAQQIKALESVSSISGYLTDEKVSVDLGPYLNSEVMPMKFKMLIVDKNLDDIKKKINSLGIKIGEEENSIVIDSSLSSIVLNVETNLTGVENALNTFPQLIAVY